MAAEFASQLGFIVATSTTARAFRHPATVPQDPISINFNI
jgi:hypothetical protein